MADITKTPKRDIMNRVLEANGYDQRIPADFSSVVRTPWSVKERHLFASLVRDYFGSDIPVTPYVSALRDNLTGIDAIRSIYEGELDMANTISLGRDFGVFYNAFKNTFIKR